jgi:carbonic anhydrase/acetyltransferase-like protein (isoleucine patch superfamily)
MIIKEICGKSPQFGDNCYLAENCVVVGDVIIGDNCSVWFSAVIRGDVNYIRIGDNVNIQDGAVVHCTYEKYPTIIGSNVTVGHNAIVHGCTIHDNVLIGMGAIVMDDAVVASNSIIAAGAVVTQGMKIGSGVIYAGVPARKVKELKEQHISGEIERIASSYITYAGWFK